MPRRRSPRRRPPWASRPSCACRATSTTTRRGCSTTARRASSPRTSTTPPGAARRRGLPLSAAGQALDPRRPAAARVQADRARRGDAPGERADPGGGHARVAARDRERRGDRRGAGRRRAAHRHERPVRRDRHPRPGRRRARRGRLSPRHRRLPPARQASRHGRRVRSAAHGKVCPHGHALHPGRIGPVAADGRGEGARGLPAQGGRRGVGDMAERLRFLPPIDSRGYYVLLGVVAIFILGPLGGIAAAYMNFSLGFFVGGQVLAGILGSVVTFGYGAPGKHGANYMQSMAASVAGMAAMGVLIQTMLWLGLAEPPTWQLIAYFLCIGMLWGGLGMLS